MTQIQDKRYAATIELPRDIFEKFHEGFFEGGLVTQLRFRKPEQTQKGNMSMVLTLAHGIEFLLIEKNENA